MRRLAVGILLTVIVGSAFVTCLSDREEVQSSTEESKIYSIEDDGTIEYYQTLDNFNRSGVKLVYEETEAVSQ